jgi:hypothetical protein
VRVCIRRIHIQWPLIVAAKTGGEHAMEAQADQFGHRIDGLPAIHLQQIRIGVSGSDGTNPHQTVLVTQLRSGTEGRVGRHLPVTRAGLNLHPHGPIHRNRVHNIDGFR